MVLVLILLLLLIFIAVFFLLLPEQRSFPLLLQPLLRFLILFLKFSVPSLRQLFKVNGFVLVVLDPLQLLVLLIEPENFNDQVPLDRILRIPLIYLVVHLHVYRGRLVPAVDFLLAHHPAHIRAHACALHSLAHSTGTRMHAQTHVMTGKQNQDSMLLVI